MPPSKKIVQTVSIIESPSSADVYEDRREGYSLVAALKLGGVPVRYFPVSNMVTLERAIGDIAREPAAMHHLRPHISVSTELYIPCVHISAHGNEKGIALTDGTFVEWKILARLLDRLNEKKGYVGDEQKRGVSSLALSCCKGSYGRTMLVAGKPFPVYCVIGSDEDVPWADALTAWVTYYHLVIVRDFKAKDALHVMNLATGSPTPLFKIFLGDTGNSNIAP